MTKIILAVTDSVSAGFFKGQVNFLKENGFDVFFISSYGERAMDLSNKEGCHYISIPFRREIAFFSDIKCLYRSVLEIKKIKPEIINAGTPKAGFILMIAAFLCNVKIRVFTLHGLRSSTLVGFKKSVVTFTEKVSCMLANNIIVVSKSLKEEAVAKGITEPEKCVVLGKGSFNGIDIERFNTNSVNLEASERYSKKFGINKNSMVIGFVGRVVKSKGIEELYEAFLKLLERFPNLILLVVGRIEKDDQVDKDILDNMLSNEKIMVTGPIPDIENLYSLLDILVLPSYREGFGNVLIEGSAMGLPVVASNISGCKDAVEQNKSGFLVEPKSVESLQDGLEKYILSEILRKEHGSYGFNRANSYFSNQYVWQHHLKFYQKLLINKGLS